MTARPCATCGAVITTGTYCDDHKPTPAPRHRPHGHVHTNPAAWKRLSARARRAQPWCTDCGTTTDLTTDHVLPVATYPELVYAEENLAVRCRSDNARRAHTGYTEADAHEVLTRLQAAYRRHPTRKGRERVNAAQRAVQAAQGRGNTPSRNDFRSARRRTLDYTPGGGVR